MSPTHRLRIRLNSERFSNGPFVAANAAAAINQARPGSSGNKKTPTPKT